MPANPPSFACPSKQYDTNMAGLREVLGEANQRLAADLVATRSSAASSQGGDATLPVDAVRP